MTLLNDAFRALGGTPALIGRPLAEGLPSAAAQGVIALLDRVLSGGVPYQANEFEYAVTRPDGTREKRWYTTSFQPVQGPNGESTGVVAAGLDVTEAVLARRELERAHRLKDEFLARVSHELATPLFALRTWVELLRTDAAPRERALEAISHCVEAQSKLIGDLLDATRAASGKLRLSVEEVPARAARRARGRRRPGARRRARAVARARRGRRRRGGDGRPLAARPGARQPPRQRAQVHASGRAGAGRGRPLPESAARSRCATPAGASSPSRARCCSPRSGRPPRAPAAATAASGSGSQSPSSSSRSTAARSPRRAPGRARGRRSPSRSPRRTPGSPRPERAALLPRPSSRACGCCSSTTTRSPGRRSGCCSARAGRRSRAAPRSRRRSPSCPGRAPRW